MSNAACGAYFARAKAPARLQHCAAPSVMSQNSSGAGFRWHLATEQFSPSFVALSPYPQCVAHSRRVVGKFATQEKRPPHDG